MTKHIMEKCCVWWERNKTYFLLFTIISHIYKIKMKSELAHSSISTYKIKYLNKTFHITLMKKWEKLLYYLIIGASSAKLRILKLSNSAEIHTNPHSQAHIKYISLIMSNFACPTEPIRKQKVLY